MKFIQITKDNIGDEHICCAFSDKKCAASYASKKTWLKQQMDSGYVFYRLDERTKVFIEYGPAEHAWLPISADNYLNINCFWVSGKYKRSGLGKALLNKAETDAKEQNKQGLVTVVGKKKYHFMGDGKWFQKQGFKVADETATGFVLLVKQFCTDETDVHFYQVAHEGVCAEKEGLTAYYSHRCPYAEYHVEMSLRATAEKRGIPLTIIKIDNIQKARSAPSPATIFSLFYKGQFQTTDLSVCMDSRFDKFWLKANP